MNKTFVTVLILVIIVLGGYFLLQNPEAQAPTTGTPISLPVTDQSVLVDENVVVYSDTGYSPSTLNVKVGDIVTFKNNSSMSMWTASAMHPTHAVYPTTGGCLGSTFDACKGVQPGDSWSFKFDIVGSWKYHDHLKPSFFGTVVVK
ncbi:hypothetical protein A3B84_02490 [Candidatus Nomurabacteria bacterium RIFCSPHIGHO2_02_FULL_35_13]|uniref:Blue (type 1) copper domain-containing protein n=1 Tax=Candidatus Nomurabacteria bacterium RIFCSPHIGHO2_02_FULL_35_13 TaxID=1801748 RepID=A0A1F6VN36_9BACT|nr:MAG: hypothetical protein A3B84_02490 [Candidatus Nomurabacteria bacterium RIFCSPHIGHO2_02_FULL_35_13]